MRKLLLCACFFCLLADAGAQVKQTQQAEQIWLGYFNQTRLSNKWGMWADAHLRTRDEFANKFSVSILRFGLTYFIDDNTRLTAGYGYVSHYPNGKQKITQPEHRPWQQIQWQTSYRKKKMVQALRLEERFRRKLLNDSALADGNNFNFKLRYNFLYELPLSSKGVAPGTFSFLVNDELHINFGKEIVNNYFDQNRLFLGFKYQLNKTNAVQLGYQHVFQQLAAGNSYRTINGVRVFYLQNFDWRKKKPEPAA
ncbi:MAG: DUF2490 domain-containing protein [Chitinophagaceae bacterium]|nr:MAG: DUF2490 domain-containing protein [Chitinophagaceae bacterium]